MFESSLNSYSWIGVFAEKIEELQKIVSKIFQKKGKKNSQVYSGFFHTRFHNTIMFLNILSLQYKQLDQTYLSYQYNFLR